MAFWSQCTRIRSLVSYAFISKYWHTITTSIPSLGYIIIMIITDEYDMGIKRFLTAPYLHDVYVYVNTKTEYTTTII